MHFGKHTTLPKLDLYLNSTQTMSIVQSTLTPLNRRVRYKVAGGCSSSLILRFTPTSRAT